MSDAVVSLGEDSPPVVAAAKEHRSANWRLIFLLGLLGMALFALWYDYKVARVGVERAYSAVGGHNTEMNRMAGRNVTRSADVQRLLGRAPSRVMQEGIYTVEVYEWMKGLPVGMENVSTRPTIGLASHDYYAVYLGSGPRAIFMRHYKFHLPTDELADARTSALPDGFEYIDFDPDSEEGRESMSPDGELR